MILKNVEKIRAIDALQVEIWDKFSDQETSLGNSYIFKEGTFRIDLDGGILDEYFNNGSVLYIRVRDNESDRIIYYGSKP